MEQPIATIEQPLETLHETSDKGLDDQSFFDALEQQKVKPHTQFIMQRMLRFE